MDCGTVRDLFSFLKLVANVLGKGQSHASNRTYPNPEQYDKYTTNNEKKKMFYMHLFLPGVWKLTFSRQIDFVCVFACDESFFPIVSLIIIILGKYRDLNVNH